MSRQLCILFASALLALPAAAQMAGEAPVKVSDYTIFVDPPTGFAFVKLPSGWKFVGKVGEEAVASLPANVVTSLLPRDPDAVDVAERTPAPPAKHPGNG